MLESANTADNLYVLFAANVKRPLVALYDTEPLDAVVPDNTKLFPVDGIVVVVGLKNNQSLSTYPEIPDVPADPVTPDDPEDPLDPDVPELP